MKKLAFLWILLIIGCGIFNPTKYNPNPTPKPVVEEPIVDTVKTDIIKIIIVE
tara:strand:+ start:252 stop:410 length:159 start_codon:yes stop_codon:yes gene_type:complete